MLRLNQRLIEIEQRLGVLQRFAKKAGLETETLSATELKERLHMKLMKKTTAAPAATATKPAAPAAKPATKPTAPAAPATYTKAEVDAKLKTLAEELSEVLTGFVPRLEALELAARGLGDFVSVGDDGLPVLNTKEATGQVLREWAWIFGFDDYDSGEKALRAKFLKLQEKKHVFTNVRRIDDLPAPGGKPAKAAKAAPEPEVEAEEEAAEETQEIDEETLGKMNWAELVQVAEDNEIDYSSMGTKQSPKVLRQIILAFAAASDETEEVLEEEEETESEEEETEAEEAEETEEEEGDEIKAGDYFSVETDDGTIYGTYTGEQDEDGDPILDLDDGNQAAVALDQLTPAEKPKKAAKPAKKK